MRDQSISPFTAEIVAWVLLCSGLAIGVGIETDWGKRMAWPIEARVDSIPATFNKPPLNDPFSLPSADKYLEIAMRPLFVITRRPAPDRPSVEPPKPQMKKGQFTLTGTLLIGSTRFAQLFQKEGNKSHVVAEGKEINGISIKQILANQVVLGQHDDTEVLVLQTVKGVLVSPPPMPVAKPPAPLGNPLTSPPGSPPILKP